MRFVLTTLLWLVTTVALALALPTAWAQRHLVDTDGYTKFSESAAADPALQQAVASELTNQLVTLSAAGEYGVIESQLRAVADSYTAGSDFPGQFAQANRFAHRWLFTNTVESQPDSQGRWVIDLGPMLADTSFQQTLEQYGVTAPSSLPVPLTERASAALKPGQLRDAAAWGPWISVGATVLAGVFALLTLAVARRRGKALVALGFSALLVGGAGWAGLEIGRRYLDGVLSNTTGNVRVIADSMVSHAVDLMHHWLNLTLIGGAGLVLLGLVFSMLGGIGRRTSTRDEPRSAPAA